MSFRVIPAEQRDEAQRLFDAGWQQAALARRFGVSSSTMCRWLSAEAKMRHEQQRQELIVQARQLRHQGLSHREIAERLAERIDVSSRTIGEWVADISGEVPLRERLLARVEVNTKTDCWLWTGASHEFGYGVMSWQGRQQASHRLSYEEFCGSIPKGLTIDHLCRTPACINPGHLEPVTQRENVLRGVGVAAVNAVKTHCIHGHPFDAENTRYKKDGRRDCKACDRKRARERARSIRRGSSEPSLDLRHRDQAVV